MTTTLNRRAGVDGGLRLGSMSAMRIWSSGHLASRATLKNRSISLVLIYSPVRLDIPQRRAIFLVADVDVSVS